MDIDFHFNATFTAALIAGYSIQDAKTIAHSSQYIDDCGESERLDTRRFVDPELLMTPIATALPSLTEMGHMDRSSTAKLIATDRRMWTAFHFLPGNLDNKKVYEGPKNDHGISDSFTYNELAQEEFKSMCLPDSPLAIEMINDTVTNYPNDLHMIGIRMHVLIDTFAHMYYCGSAAWHVNDVGTSTEYQPTGSNDWKSFEVPLYTFVNPYYDSIMYTGHARMGHIPDYPWIKYRYHPMWSQQPIEKDNPRAYMKAFQEMVYAMRCIRNNTRYVPDDSVLNDQIQGPTQAAVDEIIHGIPKEGNLNNITIQFYDWTDERCGYWRDSQALRNAVLNNEKMKYPDSQNYPDYDSGEWKSTAERSNSPAVYKATDYHKFQRAAHAHLAFVEKYLQDKGLHLLGTFAPVTKAQMVAYLDHDIRIRPAQGDDVYWEIENNTKDDGAKIQLWSGTRPENIWQLQYDSTQSGVDYFKIYNPKQGNYATYIPNQYGHNLASRSAVKITIGAQSFPITQYADGSFGFIVGTSSEIVSEDGNLGNSTKIISRERGSNHPEWARWIISIME